MRATLAVAKAKSANQRIKDIWAARLSVEYKEAKKTSTAEVAVILDGLEWEEKYTILGKNTHVCENNVLKGTLYFNAIFKAQTSLVYSNILFIIFFFSIYFR